MDCCSVDIDSLDCDPNLLKTIRGKGSSLAFADGDTIHFMVTDKKERHFMEHCNSVVASLDPVATLNRYTEHTNGLYREINLALASDSEGLRQHGQYIQQLRASILMKPLLESGPLFRGVTLSKPEIDQMELLKHFYIPSFTSTSVDSTKAYDKTAILCITTGYCCKYACSVTAELSRYYQEEREVLLPCYTSFRLQRVEMVNNKKILSLHLDEYSSSLDALTK